MQQEETVEKIEKFYSMGQQGWNRKADKIRRATF